MTPDTTDCNRRRKTYSVAGRKEVSPKRVIDAQRGARVAVLIPAYNARDRLLKTLRSIDIQEYEFDVFIVDDGSDPPVQLETAYFRHSVKIIRLPRNQGIVAALNAGLCEISSGPYEYVSRQDCGDVDLDDRIRQQVEFMDRHPEVALLGTWVQFVDTTGAKKYVYRAPESNDSIRRRMCYSCAFIHPACMIRASALRQIGFYSDRYPCAEDYDLFFRLVRKYSSANLPRVLVASQIDPAGISVAQRHTSLNSRLRIQLKYFSAGSLSAYLGVVRSLLFYLIPYRALLKMKAVMKEVR